ncbi:MAG: replication-associated recombination protein A [bacterium]
MKREPGIFDEAMRKELNRANPLATRMRPKTLEDFVGQEHLLDEGKPLRLIIEKGFLVSMVFWGAPGTGKTSLARLIAAGNDAHFEAYSAVTSQLSDIRRVVKEAGDRLGESGRRTILFVDEFHRFNRAQQDAFLPHLESGLITLIGATTENPYFVLNPAIRSRISLFHFERLGDPAQKKLLDRALAQLEKEGAYAPRALGADAAEELLLLANGDARVLLNLLELSVMLTGRGNRISSAHVREVAAHRAMDYDRLRTDRYDVVSAFIKSMRGSNPDAALYWMVRLLEGGEAPEFIARRMVIFAAEDVGCASPQAISVAVAASAAVEYVGMPEAEIPLAFCCVFLASCPKSNAAYRALKSAKKDVLEKPLEAVPLHLRNYDFTKEKTSADSYLYPHDFPGHFVEQEYFPPGLEGAVYYVPTDMGSESAIRQRLESIRKKMYGASAPGGESRKYSKSNKAGPEKDASPNRKNKNF